MGDSWVSSAAAMVAVLFMSLAFQTKAQITTACTTSMISSFTPCLNFVTGSTGSASKGCCDSLKSLMTDNMDCACLIVTGNVPVSVPFINANLGNALPRACKSSIPLQCKASGVPLPAPGPVLFAPPPPPAHVLAPAPALAPAHGHGHAHAHAPTPAPHSHSPKGSKAVGVGGPPPAESLDAAPASPPKFVLGPSANPGIRPVLNLPNSASTPSSASFVVISVGMIALWFY